MIKSKSSNSYKLKLILKQAKEKSDKFLIKKNNSKCSNKEISKIRNYDSFKKFIFLKNPSNLIKNKKVKKSLNIVKNNNFITTKNNYKINYSWNYNLLEISKKLIIEENIIEIKKEKIKINELNKEKIFLNYQEIKLIKKYYSDKNWENIYSLICNYSFFYRLQNNKKDLIKNSELIILNKNEKLNYEIKNLYIIIQGSINFYKTLNSYKILINLKKEGSIIGEEKFYIKKFKIDKYLFYSNENTILIKINKKLINKEDKKKLRILFLKNYNFLKNNILFTKFKNYELIQISTLLEFKKDKRGTVILNNEQKIKLLIIFNNGKIKINQNKIIESKNLIFGKLENEFWKFKITVFSQEIKYYIINKEKIFLLYNSIIVI